MCQWVIQNSFFVGRRSGLALAKSEIPLTAWPTTHSKGVFLMPQRFSITPARAYSDTRLSDNDLRVLGVIGLHTDKDGWCRPSLATVGEYLKCSPSTASRRISRLVGLGYINSIARFDGKVRLPNWLQVKFDFPLEEKDTTPLQNEPRNERPPCTDERDPERPPCKTSREMKRNAPLNAPLNDNTCADEKAVSAPKPPQPENPTERKPNAIYQLAVSLSEVCHMDIVANKGRLLRDAKVLGKCTPPATPELIKQHYNGNPQAFWKSKTWLGKKGEYPTPEWVRKTWGQWTTQSDFSDDTISPEQAEEWAASVHVRV